MNLFAPDLYRNFAFGFIAGGLVVGAATIGDWGHNLASPANAAEVQTSTTLAPASEFIIEPLGE